MQRWVVAFVAGLILAWPSAAEVEKSTWRVVARCASGATVGPGQGLFEVRYKTRGMNAEAIEIRGCGANHGFRKYFEWGGDAVRLDFYALPFFEKGKLDFLLELGWDDSTDYILLEARAGYDQVVKFTAVDSAFFGDADRDGRWEIQIAHLLEVECGNGLAWRPDLVNASEARLSADTLCKARSPEPPKL